MWGRRRHGVIRVKRRSHQQAGKVPGGALCIKSVEIFSFSDIWCKWDFGYFRASEAVRTVNTSLAGTLVSVRSWNPEEVAQGPDRPRAVLGRPAAARAASGCQRPPHPGQAVTQGPASECPPPVPWDAQTGRSRPPALRRPEERAALPAAADGLGAGWGGLRARQGLRAGRC